MHACSDYIIRLIGSEDAIRTATTVLAETFQDESLIGESCITIEETYDVVWVEDIAKLAEVMTKTTPNISSFTITGTVDTSESAGEYMDFLIKYENNTLSVQSSCWYVLLDTDEFEDYEEFCDEYEGYSEGEFEEFQECQHFILDRGDGDIVAEVPLDDPEIIDLDATSVFIEKDDAKRSPIPVCCCECGNEVTLENNDMIFRLYMGASLPVVCEKCGKKYKVFIK